MLADNVKKREAYAQYQLDLHEGSLDPEHPRDFIDAYLIRLKHVKEKGEPSTFEGRLKWLQNRVKIDRIGLKNPDRMF